ncbi:hypothetical protein, partial [Burkholderia gladioli]|uniref:hypothetical protein n=1 Tax=Burkholderia gladioli TaxID=28095 RepID=UPI001ABB1299
TLKNNQLRRLRKSIMGPDGENDPPIIPQSPTHDQYAERPACVRAWQASSFAGTGSLPAAAVARNQPSAKSNA